MPVYELTLRGYNSETDATDDLVKWVKAEKEERVLEYAISQQWDVELIEVLEGRDSMGPEDGVDAVICT